MWLACLAEQQAKMAGDRVSFHKQVTESVRAVRATLILLQIAPKSSLEEIGTVAESGHSKNVNETDAGEVVAAV
jgi:hypothetical protein